MTIAFNRQFEPRYGEAVRLAPGVRRVTAPNPGPFTFRGTNSFLIGEDEVAVLDPGPADAGHVEALMRAIGGAKLSHILVSHTHRDHSPAARLLQARTGAPILAAGPHRPARPLRGAESARLEAGADLDFMPDRSLAPGGAVEASGYRLEVIATPGHAANHLAFALLGTDILFSGDHVMGWATTIVAPPDGAMGDYMASLECLLARPERRYLPAHGGEIADAHSYLRALIAHRKMRERAIVERLARGDRTVSEVTRRVYPDLDTPLAAAAALTVLAHLEDLVARGIAATDGEPSLTGSYWLTGPGSIETGVASSAGAAGVGVLSSG